LQIGGGEDEVIVSVSVARAPFLGNRSFWKGDWKFLPAGNRPIRTERRHNLQDGPLRSPPLSNDAHLFNLVEDPGETNHVIEPHPQIAAEWAQLPDGTIRRSNPGTWAVAKAIIRMIPPR